MILGAKRTQFLGRPGLHQYDGELRCGVVLFWAWSARVPPPKHGPTGHVVLLKFFPQLVRPAEIGSTRCQLSQVGSSTDTDRYSIPSKTLLISQLYNVSYHDLSFLGSSHQKSSESPRKSQSEWDVYLRFTIDFWNLQLASCREVEIYDLDRNCIRRARV